MQNLNLSTAGLYRYKKELGEEIVTEYRENYPEILAKAVIDIKNCFITIIHAYNSLISDPKISAENRIKAENDKQRSFVQMVELLAGITTDLYFKQHGGMEKEFKTIVTTARELRKRLDTEPAVDIMESWLRKQDNKI